MAASIASKMIADARDMIDVDVQLHSGDYLGSFMHADWIQLQKLTVPTPGKKLMMSLKVRPVLTYLKYLRSIHLPDGLSKTTSVSKTVGQSSTVSVEASISETVEAGIGVVEDSTEFSLSVGYSSTWESSRTTEDSFTLTGPTSIYFYQPVTVMAYMQSGIFPAPFLGTYPSWATKKVGQKQFMLTSIMLDRTVGLNTSVGLVSFKTVCQFLFGDGWTKWKP